MEHHSNLVPWHMLQAERGIELDFIPETEAGFLDLSAYKTLLTRTPKLVSFTHMSNVLGTINPAAEIIRLAHEAGAVTLVDAAQSVPHLKVDVQGQKPRAILPRDRGKGSGDLLQSATRGPTKDV